MSLPKSLGPKDLVIFAQWDLCKISDLQSCEIINTCSLKATIFVVFVMAPYKTNTGGHGCCN